MFSSYQASHGAASIWDTSLYSGTSAPSSSGGAAGGTRKPSSSSSSTRHKFSPDYRTALRFAQHPNYTGAIADAKLVRAVDPATLPKKRALASRRPERAPRGKYAHYPHANEHGLVPGGIFGYKPDASVPKACLVVNEPESPRGKHARFGTNLPKEAWQAYKDREKNPRGRAARFSAELDPFPGRYPTGLTREVE
ncbi:unnamed protein product [Amoebophrya sp. A120]|nr:unnamed protein product [Amoebophrya sp. A120]|eukprot:GSA120T00011452001.1